jgi:hypothetical protein
MEDRDIFTPASVDAISRHHRLRFRYYKDRYAAMLLENILKPHLPLRALRSGPYGRLLDRPAIKALAASKGDGILHRDDLLMLWPLMVETYVLTFGVWGSSKRRDRRWNQTSRPRRQLVLQLNFSRQHDMQYQRLIDNEKRMPFVCQTHPVNLEGRNTLAWARIDIDFFSGEALIEEVQNDWLRNAEEDLADAVRGRGGFRKPELHDNLKVYAESVLARHVPMWSEATLAAAIDVLNRVFGTRRVWFHSFDTGCEIKNLLEGKQPPCSLYTDLPKRFCFEKTAEAPAFILPGQSKRLRQKLERGEGRFWRLDTSSCTAERAA